jgi:hypothetical protein
MTKWTHLAHDAHGGFPPDVGMTEAPWLTSPSARASE